MTVKVSVPAAVGVPLIARLPVPLAGTVRPAIAPWILLTARVTVPVPPAGRDRLVVGHVDRVRPAASPGPSSTPGSP